MIPGLLVFVTMIMRLVFVWCLKLLSSSLFEMQPNIRMTGTKARHRGKQQPDRAPKGGKGKSKHR
jgi:hypothetical protein